MSDAVKAVYAAHTDAEIRAAYEGWANDYDRDLMAMGYRLPTLMTAVVLDHLTPRSGQILDAGCGTGLHAEMLPHFGFERLCGLDPSEAMLEVAREKGIYAALSQGFLGDGMAQFETDQFDGALSCGTITPGHAGVSSFDDLIRAVRCGGHIVFSLRDDAGQDPAYEARMRALEEEGAWRQLYRSHLIQTMPYGEPEVFNRVFVYEVL